MKHTAVTVYGFILIVVLFLLTAVVVGLWFGIAIGAARWWLK